MTNVYIRQAAVLGAGTMGAQIAAHFANAGIKTYLFDLPTKDQPNKVIEGALTKLKSIDPAPLASPNCIQAIIPANYKDNLEYLRDCDIIVEAVAENIDIKAQLYENLAPYISPHTIIASNTSGLSIETLANALPKALLPNFCGAHFFNPPRYMALVELIPSSYTDPIILDQLETFLTSSLGKTIIRAKDTPNFIANRIGVFSMLATMHYAEKFAIGLEVVDQLTGKVLGRPKSATFRTADLVGLDVLSHVANTMETHLPNDPWQDHYSLPTWLQGLIAAGALGQKTKKGIYVKREDGLYVWDLQTNDYRKADGKADKEVLDILKDKNASSRFEALRDSNHPQAQFLWSCFRDLFHYSAYCLGSIADNARDLDLAIRLGFGWKQGPFELWQAAGWQEMAEELDHSLHMNQTLSSVELPSWVKQLSGVYQADGAYSPTTNQFHGRRQLPVYKRQLFPQAVLAEQFNEGETLFENDGIRLWTLDNEITILSFKTKMCTIDSDVLEGIRKSIELTELSYKAMVIWQRHGEHFSAGADLMTLGKRFIFGGAEILYKTLEEFQETVAAVRYANIPVVAAVRGYVFGGGCELMMHCDKVVAALESYIGLVEVGVGIIPGAGGSKEMALRASQTQNPEQSLQAYFKNIATAEVSKSAMQAKKMGYLREGDTIIFNPDELLYVAIHQAKVLAESNYRPPLHPQIPVLGRQGKATIDWFLVNMKEGHFASEQDYLISDTLADVMCGGDLDTNALVTEEWLWHLEREAFISLVQTTKTRDRIKYMLENGKPLRN
ncbi:MAG: 3-hydroxyacyl-CoA dehydrogenase/enoyl-CoA hydratase family protein [Gammaproteobacteria bacterium]|nr:3-hydroxyacyl-CoA dehydrogenase/enoyl-CoA hydratase family protein [Gammaproteobacteria bacterium]